MHQSNYIQKLLKKNSGIEVTFYCLEENHPGVRSMMERFDRFNLAPLGATPPPEAIPTWIGKDGCPMTDYNAGYLVWFGMLSQKAGVDNPVKTTEDWLFELTGVDTHHGFFDAFVVNSQPRSGQWRGGSIDWVVDKLAAEGMRVATSHPHPKSSFCVTEEGMSIQQLINFAPVCARVIGIDNAPMLATFSSEMFKVCKSWHVCHDFNHYSLPNFSMIRSQRDLQELLS